MYGLILIYALTAVGSLAALRYPFIGFYIYAGFSVVRPQAMWGWAGDVSNVSQIVALAMLAGWAMKGFGSWKFGSGRSIVVALLIYGLWSAMATPQAVDVTVATAALIEFLKVVLPFFVGVTLLSTERDARALIWVLVGAQAYVGFELNMSYLGGNNVAQSMGFGGMDNNALGIGLVAAVGAALGLLLSAKTWTERGFAAGSALIIMHTVLLTFSRGAMLGLVTVGGTAALVMPKRPKYVAAIAIGLVITLQLTGPELIARFDSTFAEKDERDWSAGSRIDLWADCLSVAIEQPFLGVGPKNWPVIAEQFGWPPGKEAHSVWMQTLTEVGFPGVLALIAFYAMTIGKFWWRLWHRNAGPLTPTMNLGLGIILSIVGYSVSAQFVSLQGLEFPFYVVAAGVVLLKTPPEPVTRPGIVAAPLRSTYRAPNMRERTRVQPVRTMSDQQAPRGGPKPGRLLG